MTTYIAYQDNSKTDVEGHSKHLNRMMTPGVVNTLTATSLQVLQRAAGSNLSVDVQIGDALLQVPSTAYSVHGYTDSVTNVPLGTTPDVTNPRLDTLVCWQDKNVNSTVNAQSPGAFKFSFIAGTPSGSPVAVSDAAIQTALGASVPWQRLAYVTVAANATQLTNAVITDARSISKLLLPANTIARNTIREGYGQRTTNYDFTSITDVPLLTASIVSPGNKDYSINFYSGDVYSSGSGDRVNIRIQEGATVLQESYVYSFAAGRGGTRSVSVEITPSAGAHTYKITAERDIGGGLGTMYASPTAPAYISVKAI